MKYFNLTNKFILLINNHYLRQHIVLFTPIVYKKRSGDIACDRDNILPRSYGSINCLNMAPLLVTDKNYHLSFYLWSIPYVL